jgi:hypothetical protein
MELLLSDGIRGRTEAAEKVDPEKPNTPPVCHVTSKKEDIKKLS